MTQNRKAVRKVLAKSFTVGWDYDVTIYEREDQGGTKRWKSSNSGSTESFPKKVKNMREFSEKMKYWFYAPFNMSRNPLRYKVNAKLVRDGGIEVTVEWPTLRVTVEKTYYPWIGEEKKPLSENNLNQLLGLVKKWNMSDHWEYDS